MPYRYFVRAADYLARRVHVHPQALLRRDGLELLTARSGPEALELLLRYDVALALLVAWFLWEGAGHALDQSKGRAA